VTDFYSLAFCKARKEHECDCFLASGPKDPHHYRTHKIHKGQKYAVIAQVYDGDFYANKLCLTHHALINAIFKVCDDTRDDGIDYERAREHYEEVNAECKHRILAKMRELHRELKPKKPAKHAAVIDLSDRIKDRDAKVETELERRVVERWKGKP
jgi:hypothetical protein